MSKSFQFIINPISGIKQKIGIVEELKKSLLPEINYGIAFTERAEHATELTLEAVKNGADAVIAVGGDGSVHEVGKALVNTNVALGVIPCGSGNGFARHLKIPLQLNKAIQKLNNFQLKKIDTGSVNGEAFLATAGFGFDAQIGHKFANFGKRGFFAYLQVVFNEFFSYQAKHHNLTIDGKKIITNAFIVSIANVGQYGNNAWISPSALETDGLLDVCIIEKFPSHKMPKIVYNLFSKSIAKSSYYKHYLAKEIRIFNPEILHLDGEPKVVSEELIIKVNPSSLNVIC